MSPEPFEINNNIMIDLKRHSSSTEPDRLKLIITIDEDEPIKVSVEAMTS